MRGCVTQGCRTLIAFGLYIHMPQAMKAREGVQV